MKPVYAGAVPALPGEGILSLLAIAVVLLCAGMILFLALRRVWIQFRGRAEEALADRFEALLLGWLHGDVPQTDLARFVARPERKRILAIVKAVARVELQPGRADLRDRLREADLPRLIAGALDPKRDRWTRAAAARALGVLAYSEGIPALVTALDDTDFTVAYTAASALATLGLVEAAQPLLDRVGKNSHLNNARLVALVERMKCDIRPLLRPMLAKDDPVAAFWALGLVAERKDFEMVEKVKPFLSHADANVRAAAAECVGKLRVPLTDRWLDPCLDDEAWFVKCHAAKALGEMNAVWAAERILPLLEDREWWCRHNGADALVLLGQAAVPALERFLEHSEDRFARNSAVEALERAGWFERQISEASRGNARAVALLRLAGHNGGVGYLENALESATGAALEAVFDLLLEVGDISSAGRIKRAIHQQLLPVSAVPRAREVAAALGRP